MAKSYVELIADKKRIKPNSLYKSNGKTALTEIRAEEVTINGFTFKYTIDQLRMFEQLKVEHDLQVQTLKEVCVGILIDCGVNISHLDIKTSSVFYRLFVVT